MIAKVKCNFLTMKQWQKLNKFLDILPNSLQKLYIIIWRHIYKEIFSVHQFAICLKHSWWFISFALKVASNFLGTILLSETHLKASELNDAQECLSDEMHHIIILYYKNNL